MVVPSTSLPQNFQFLIPPGPCLKFLFSRLLSFVVIVGAVIGRHIYFNLIVLIEQHTYTHTIWQSPPVKVPQILKILHAHSVENLSYLAFLLELAAVTFTCTYNYAKGFPFRYLFQCYHYYFEVITSHIIKCSYKLWDPTPQFKFSCHGSVIYLRT